MQHGARILAAPHRGKPQRERSELFPAAAESEQLLPVADHGDRRHEHLVGQHEPEEAEGVAPDPEPEQVEDPASLEAVQDGVDDRVSGSTARV
jgi:hypothetical protein